LIRTDIPELTGFPASWTWGAMKRFTKAQFTDLVFSGLRRRGVNQKIKVNGGQVELE